MSKVQIKTTTSSDGKIHTEVAHDCEGDLIKAAATLVHGMEAILVEINEAVKKLNEANGNTEPAKEGEAPKGVPLVLPTRKQMRSIERSRVRTP